MNWYFDKFWRGAIIEYYSNHAFAKNFPLQAGKPYHPVYTDFMYSFTLDFEERDEAKEVIFGSFDEYKHLIKQSKKELDNLFPTNT